MGLTWETQVKVAKGVLLLNLCIAGFGFFIFDPWIDFVRGLAFGAIIAVLNFRLLALTIERSVKLPPNKAQIYAGTRYVIRYSINAVVLMVSLKADYINALGTIIGLISIKPIVLRIGLFDNAGFFKRIILRERRKSDGGFWS